MTRCLAAEWAADGIRVINVAPGYVETALNREFLAREDMRRYIESRVPLKRAGRPEEVARLVAALLTEEHPLSDGRDDLPRRLARDRPLTGAHPPGGTAVSGDSPVHIHQPGRSP